MALWQRLVGMFGGTDGAEPAVVPPPNRMAALGTTRQLRRVNLGLDFGTSTTKVVVRIDEAAAKPRYLIVKPSEATDTVLFPSTAAFEDGELLFGATAEQSSAAAKVRSFKMNLPAEAGSRQHAWRGRMQLGDTDLSAEALSMLYLAWVFKDVLDQVKESLAGADLKVTVNCAAPLDQIEAEPQLRALFHRVFFRALTISSLAHARWSLADARRALAEALTLPVPADEDSPVSLFPETHAAMTSYMLLPGRHKGNYATVDVGAGSTDVAFFWFHATDGQPEMCYYGARSEFVGMDDIDRALADSTGNHVERVRNLRESGRINPGMHAAALAPVLNQIYQCYREGFGRSYDRCRGESEWRHPNGHARYTLCLVGGGCLCVELVDRLSKILTYFGMLTVDVEVLRVPDDLPVLRSGERARCIGQIAPGERSLLLLAHGLANRAVDIPKYESGHEHVKIRLLADRPSHEELYAK